MEKPLSQDAKKSLLTKMQELGIHGNLYKWIKDFLTDRLIQTKVGNAYSSKKVLEEGLPQGSALSSTLFLIFLNGLPQEIKSDKSDICSGKLKSTFYLKSSTIKTTSIYNNHICKIRATPARTHLEGFSFVLKLKAQT